MAIAQVSNSSAPGVSRTIGQISVPLIVPSSATIGNNGALSAMTALPTTESGYISLPAGAIATGVPAAQTWYWFVGSSTTAGTVYNNTYTSGTPVAPASPTPFVTTGPGAYTQTTGSLIPAYSLSIPGNFIGVNGSVKTTGLFSMNTSASAKVMAAQYSTYKFCNTSLTADTAFAMAAGFMNINGVTNAQGPLSTIAPCATGASAAGQPSYGAIDSTTSQNLTIQLQLALATDFLQILTLSVEYLPGVP